MTQHVWGSAALVVSSQVWNQISAEDQAVVQAAALEWGKKQRQMVADSDAEMTEKLKAEGMEFNDVDRAAFAEAVAPIWASEAEAYGPELMTLMDAARK